MSGSDTDPSYSPSSSQSEELSGDSDNSQGSALSSKAHLRKVLSACDGIATLEPSDDPSINSLFKSVVSKSDGQLVFKCLECSKEYRRPYDARRHGTNVHMKTVKCEICSERVKGSVAMREHMSRHRDRQARHTRHEVDQPSTSRRVNERSRSRVNQPMKALPIKRELEETEMQSVPSASILADSLVREVEVKTAKVEMREMEEERKGEIVQERRSTRIQMRLAMEASTMEMKRVVEGGKEEEGEVEGGEETGKMEYLEMPLLKSFLDSCRSETSSPDLVATASEALDVKPHAVVIPAAPAASATPAASKRAAVAEVFPALISVKKERVEEEAIVMVNEAMIVAAEEEVAACEASPTEVEAESPADAAESQPEVAADAAEPMETKPKHALLPSCSILPSPQGQQTPGLAVAVKEESKQVAATAAPAARNPVKSVMVKKEKKVRKKNGEPKKKRQSRILKSGGVSASSSSTSIVSIPSDPTDWRAAARAAAAARPASGMSRSASRSDSSTSLGSGYGQMMQPSPLLQPAAAAAQYRQHPQLQPLQQSRQTMISSSVQSAAAAASVIERAGRSSSNSYLPSGITSIYGERVHQSQPVPSVPSHCLYPSPLTATLLHSTVYHPEWRRRGGGGMMGEDERKCISSVGHAHFLLPTRLHRTETMVEKCMRAVEDCAMPLPPLLPLFPSPCAAVERGEGGEYESLRLVLPRRLPPVVDEPIDEVTGLRVHSTAFYGRTTMAFEGARQHVTVKSEERKWWEIRTFPSFSSLCPSLILPRSSPSLPSQMEGVVYGMADSRQHGRSATRNRMKCTYVTSKRPIFSTQPSVAAADPRLQQQQGSSVAAPAAVNQSALGTRPNGSRQIPRSLQYGQLKRPADTQAGEVDALIKRIKTSYNESYPGRQNCRQPQQMQHVQQVQQQQSVAQPTHEATPDIVCVATYRRNAAAAAASAANGTGTNQKEAPPVIEIDQDGTSFTVL